MRVTFLGHAGLLVETAGGSIVCDPWFTPAYFASWFVFPRNDRLAPEVMAAVARPSYLYVSHLHADHFDAAFLAEHVDHDTPVLLPDFPTGDLEAALRSVGFHRFVETAHGEPVDLGGGLQVAVFCETAIADGPQGDSAIVVHDGTTTLVNQNDCRPGDVEALKLFGPVDAHFLQFSGAIWYPVVYEVPAGEMERLCRAKRESQMTRAVRYVRSLGAAHVFPSAGPPCFLDPELFHLNDVDNRPDSIFPDQLAFLARLREEDLDGGLLVLPGSVVDLSPGGATVEHPGGKAAVAGVFADKLAYLRAYQADWLDWIDAQRALRHGPSPDLIGTLRDWWGPLMAMAPRTCAAIGAPILFRLTGEAPLDVLVDPVAAAIDEWDGSTPYGFSFTLDRSLFETVVAERAVDWSNALFLSCRFSAWRAGAYNEYLYNFLKSLSPERMARAEAQVVADELGWVDDDGIAGPTEIELDGHLVERWCPHRQADLAEFGRVADGVLTCELHGWRFDLATGECLTAPGRRRLRVRPAPTASAATPPADRR